MDGKWTDEDKRELTKAVTVLVDMQKNYGKEINLKTLLTGWKMILEDSYTVKQVIQALGVYMKNKSDIPAPADLIKIIEPEEDRITYEQYRHAQEQQRLSNYPQFSYHAEVIRQYEEQKSSDRDKYRIENDSVRQLVNKSINRIN